MDQLGISFITVCANSLRAKGELMSFIENYIDLLIQNSGIPKFQSERAIFSLIEPYIGDIVCFLTKKTFEFVTIELPLPVDGTNQSTNIDSMLYNKNENRVLVVELKTEHQGNDHHLVQLLSRFVLSLRSAQTAPCTAGRNCRLTECYVGSAYAALN